MELKKQKERIDKERQVMDFMDRFMKKKRELLELEKEGLEIMNMK